LRALLEIIIPGKIRAVEGNPYLKDWAEDPFYFGEISILEPKRN